MLNNDLVLLQKALSEKGLLFEDLTDALQKDNVLLETFSDVINYISSINVHSDNRKRNQLEDFKIGDKVQILPTHTGLDEWTTGIIENIDITLDTVSILIKFIVPLSSGDKYTTVKNINLIKKIDLKNDPIQLEQYFNSIGLTTEQALEYISNNPMLKDFTFTTSKNNE